MERKESHQREINTPKEVEARRGGDPKKGEQSLWNANREVSNGKALQVNNKKCGRRLKSGRRGGLRGGSNQKPLKEVLSGTVN